MDKIYLRWLVVEAAGEGFAWAPMQVAVLGGIALYAFLAESHLPIPLACQIYQP
jgi:hypothetical protein